MEARLVNHNLQVTGTAQQIEHALHTQLNYYLYKQQTVYANASRPSLQPEIAQYVVDITGLNTIPRFYPNNESTQCNESSSDLLTPKAIPTTTSTTGFSGAQLQYTYNLNNIPPVNGTHLDGKGQT